MGIPRRHSSAENVVSGQRTFFVTTSTDKNAVSTANYRDQGEYKLARFCGDAESLPRARTAEEYPYSSAHPIFKSKTAAAKAGNS
jgi:hypothetical protein